MTLKLDIGCGKNKKPDHIGIDIIAFEGVDHVLNAGKDVWPFEDDTVDEISTSHFLEHLEAMERVHFVNEAYRVLKKGAKCFIVTPHWCSTRAYGDLTHKMPPVVEFWYYYLSKQWRDVNAPHNDFYKCDFDATWGYSLAPSLQFRSQEFKQFATENYKEAIQDLHATLVKNR